MRRRIIGERGRRRRFEDLVSKSAREIHLFLYRLCGNHHDAEELAQDVFVKAYRKLDGLRDPAASRRWLYMIAANHFNDWVRPRKHAVMRRIADVADFELEGAEDMPPRAALRRELTAWIDECVRELPDRQRTVLLMTSASGFSYGDIADSLGISVDAVKMSLFHAREKLRDRVKRFLAKG